MNRELTYHITKEQNLMPIGLFLKSMGFSRKCMIQLKKQTDSVLLNGSPAYLNAPLSIGDTLSIFYREETSSKKIVPVFMPLSVLYEDEDLLVINKPSDMPIHPSMNNYDNTLANGVAAYYEAQNTPFIFRCMNRLDRDTTGVTLISKNALCAGIVSEMIARREIHREYLAIADGIIGIADGTIDAPIGRVSDSAITRAVDMEHGEKAVTHYHTLLTNKEKNASLLSIHLETGRTHQIRVHMKHIGHPLLGDFLYHPDYTYIKRQALHSYRLSLTHPITKKPMQFTAPVPDDMLFIYENNNT